MAKFPIFGPSEYRDMARATTKLSTTFALHTAWLFSILYTPGLRLRPISRKG